LLTPDKVLINNVPTAQVLNCLEDTAVALSFVREKVLKIIGIRHQSYE
jgi:hypothetical protein